MDDVSHDLVRLSSLTSGERLQLVARLLRMRTLPRTDPVSYAVTDQRMPMTLSSFYALLPDPCPSLGEQNRMFTPAEVEVEDGKLRFAVENQYVYTWSTELTGDDPAVFGRFEPAHTWEPEQNVLSSFLVQFTLFELMMAAPFGATVSCLEPAPLARLLMDLTPLDAPHWHWPSYPGRFFVRGTATLFVCPNVEDACSLWVGCESESDASFLTRHVDDSWEYVQLTRE
jgi:hypothetical protein